MILMAALTIYLLTYAAKRLTVTEADSVGLRFLLRVLCGNTSLKFRYTNYTAVIRVPAPYDMSLRGRSPKQSPLIRCGLCDEESACPGARCAVGRDWSHSLAMTFRVCSLQIKRH